MARRNIAMNEHLEMIYQWHQGRGVREISRSLHLARKTIRKYLERLMEAGIRREEPLPPEEVLAEVVAGWEGSGGFRRPAQDRLARYHTQIEQWLQEPDMTIQQVRRLLRENHAVEVGYMSLHRYVRRRLRPPEPRVTVRLHSPPGAQAQVDFGYAGRLVDPQTGRSRRAWAFILVLSYSRHRFVRFVFRQDSPTWIDCHLRAFRFFQGCVRTVVLDNLKDGVLKPDLYDPTLNPSYAELERHLGFVADPAKVRMARHKGKVERQVPVVRQQLMAGYGHLTIEEANQRALDWCCEEIGRRPHGTTHRPPYEVFLEEEQAQLLPLPAEPFEPATWRPAKIHPDCHVVFEKSFYSAPYRFRGEEVWVRADPKLVRLYRDRRLIKTHLRAERPGSWRTDPHDYPPDKLAYLERTPAYCRRRAEDWGPHVGQYVRRILSDHAMRNLRKAQGVLRLGDRYGGEALDAACRRALHFENFRYRSLRAILEQELWRESLDPSPTRAPSPPSRFTRPAHYFVHKESS
jgi:transposase